MMPSWLNEQDVKELDGNDSKLPITDVHFERRITLRFIYIVQNWITDRILSSVFAPIHAQLQ